ncbi:hypothetical protein SAMN04488516_10940 [Desulfonauticus submarinus]|uniref:Uncharacterized protein n=1 Tax=Desulfonauticus submarinus TaxID=206665 RepID=A0A1H0ETC5_9BACT|nr:hypothetical protein [Desulfonauticus submarinus]SDN85628.1 hypothetical protein SAMN04488516_10940 [Desulfonauticus submarinus]
MADIKKLLETKAQIICTKFGLSKVYFTRPLGNRQHFLGGYGIEIFTRPQKINLTNKLTMFLEGHISEEAMRALLQEITPFAKQLTKEI